MQTLQRAINRGNAVMIHNSVTQQREVYWKRGLFRITWDWAVRQSMRVGPVRDIKPQVDTIILPTRWQRFVKWIKRLFKFR